MSEQNLERIRANLEKPLSAILDKNRQKSIEGRRESRERTTEQLEQEGFTERISEVQCGGSRSCGGSHGPDGEENPDLGGNRAKKNQCEQQIRGQCRHTRKQKRPNE